MMLMQLWLPILVAAVLVFVASSLIHMLLKWHNADYNKFANENDVRAVIRAGNAAPGMYALPHCTDMKDMEKDDMKQKFKEGPIGIITLRENCPPNMGKSLGLWFALNLLIATLGAMLALQAFGVGSDSHRAGHFMGIFTMIAYSCGSIQESIWMGKPWAATLKDMLDALIYGTVTALTFWWLWP